MADKKRQHFEVSVATGFKSGSSYCVNHQTVNPKDITRKYSDFWHREAYLKKKKHNPPPNYCGNYSTMLYILINIHSGYKEATYVGLLRGRCVKPILTVTSLRSLR